MNVRPSDQSALGAASAPTSNRSAPARQAEAQQERQAEARLRQRILDRVDALVDGMQSVAQGIASPRTSPVRRSVLVERYNELRRQVNRIDGIVGSEGRESAAGLPSGVPQPARDSGPTRGHQAPSAPAAQRRSPRSEQRVAAPDVEPPAPATRSATPSAEQPAPATARPAARTGELFDLQA